MCEGTAVRTQSNPSTVSNNALGEKSDKGRRRLGMWWLAALVFVLGMGWSDNLRQFRPWRAHEGGAGSDLEMKQQGPWQVCHTDSPYQLEYFSIIAAMVFLVLCALVWSQTYRWAIVQTIQTVPQHNTAVLGYLQ